MQDIEGGNVGNVNLKKISVVTPCYNASKYIAETVKSVLGNTMIMSGEMQLQYVICDGGSSDDTLAILKDIVAKNSAIEFILVSEPDSGVCDALAKGLRLATGDVCSWINAGDIYSPTAFEVVVEMLSKKEVLWITGLQAWYNEKSHLTDCSLPFKYRSCLIQCGMYGRLLPFIQTESIFWRRELHDVVDFEHLATLRMAGDFFLWKSFSRITQLYIVSAYLGGFKRHRGQLSAENSIAYYK